MYVCIYMVINNNTGISICTLSSFIDTDTNLQIDAYICMYAALHMLPSACVGVAQNSIWVNAFSTHYYFNSFIYANNNSKNEIRQAQSLGYDVGTFAAYFDLW